MERLQQRLRRRRGRRSCYEIFYRGAKADFQRIAEADPRAADLKQLYGLHIVPGGRGGGLDKRMVEVFFGQRPFDSEQRTDEINGGFRRRTVTISEFGAALQYYRQDNDSVVVFLHAAGTRDNYKSANRMILGIVRDPCILTGAPRLKRHFDDLISVMEMTCIDGVPTVSDRLRFRWLQITRIQITGSGEPGQQAAALRPQIIEWAFAIGFFIFAVGLSGWALEIFKQALSASQ